MHTEKQNLLGHRKIWFMLQPTANGSPSRFICCLLSLSVATTDFVRRLKNYKIGETTDKIGCYNRFCFRCIYMRYILHFSWDSCDRYRGKIHIFTFSDILYLTTYFLGCIMRKVFNQPSSSSVFLLKFTDNWRFL
jgi:hypothetical protein